MLPMVVVLYFMIWRPQVEGFIWSLFKMNAYTPVEFAGLQNYVEVVTEPQFLTVLWNTVQYVLWSLVVGFLPPLFIAMMINEMVHFRNGFKITIYLPTIIPAIVGYLIWYFIYYPDGAGLLNMLLAKVGLGPFQWLNDGKFTILFITISMTWKDLGGAMLLYYAALQGIDPSLYEAAILDGASVMQRIRYVTFPRLSGIMLLCFIRQIIAVFQVMEQPMAMTSGGPNGASTSLGYQLYQYGFVTGRTGQALALGGVMFGILIIFTCFYFVLNKKVEDNT